MQQYEQTLFYNITKAQQATPTVLHCPTIVTFSGTCIQTMAPHLFQRLI